MCHENFSVFSYKQSCEITNPPQKMKKSNVLNPSVSKIR